MHIHIFIHVHVGLGPLKEEVSHGKGMDEEDKQNKGNAIFLKIFSQLTY